MVFVSFLLASTGSRAFLEFAVERNSREAAFRHSDCVACPTELLTDDVSLHAVDSSTVADLCVGDAVTEGYSHNSLETTDVKRLKLGDMTAIEGPSFTTVY